VTPAASEVRLRDGRVALLRGAEPEDAPQLVTFLRTLARESWRKLGNPPSHFDALTDEAEAAVIGNYARAPRGFLLSAWVAGEAVGSLTLSARPQKLNAHCADLGMGILCKVHRQGLGAALVRHALAEGERVGLWNVSLRVRAHNAPAIALYESQGFIRIGTLRAVAEIDGAFEDEHVYQRIAREH
jgi:RimJ/RimL family protein N-acetyltransferase